jgi:hypothetical protein
MTIFLRDQVSNISHNVHAIGIISVLLQPLKVVNKTKVVYFQTSTSIAFWSYDRCFDMGKKLPNY